jgi:hypothetical protein
MHGKLLLPQELGNFMMKTQEQPFQTQPAVEQAPVVERVVETTRRVQPVKSPVFLPMMLSYLLSIGTATLVVYLINSVFGTPYNQGLIQFESSLWRVGIPLSLIISFLLGIFLPIIFAKRKRGKIILLTLLMQFITLTAIVIAGVSQINYFS